jgi:hypothetical protein
MDFLSGNLTESDPGRNSNRFSKLGLCQIQVSGEKEIVWIWLLANCQACGLLKLQNARQPTGFGSATAAGLCWPGSMADDTCFNDGAARQGSCQNIAERIEHTTRPIPNPSPQTARKSQSRIIMPPDNTRVLGLFRRLGIGGSGSAEEEAEEKSMTHFEHRTFQRNGRGRPGPGVAAKGNLQCGSAGMLAKGERLPGPLQPPAPLNCRWGPFGWLESFLQG